MNYILKFLREKKPFGTASPSLNGWGSLKTKTTSAKILFTGGVQFSETISLDGSISMSFGFTAPISTV